MYVTVTVTVTTRSIIVYVGETTVLRCTIIVFFALVPFVITVSQL